MKAEGWDWFEQGAHFKSEGVPIDKKYAQLFSSPAGQEVLEHLKKITVDRETWTPGADPSIGFFREGQNALVRYICERIKRGANG